MKKHIILLAAGLLVLASCGGKKSQTDGNVSGDIESLKQQLTEKRAAIAQLQREVSAIEDQIVKIDPSAIAGNTRVVTTTVATRKSFDHYTEVQGTVATALDPSPAGSETGGRVLAVYVKEGQAVTAGQVVAKVDLEQLQKAIEQVQTTLTLARDVFQRQENLWKQNIGSEIQYLQAKNNVDQLEKQLETMRLQLSKAEVKAPISGTIEKVNVKQGELSGPGMPIVTIINYNQLMVKGDVAETFLKSVHVGDAVEVDFPALGIQQQARITEIGRYVNPSNRTFEVKVAVNSQGGVLKPNVIGNIRIKDRSVANAIVVPTPIISQDPDGQNYVFTVAKNDKGEAVAKRMNIKTGENGLTETLVLEGLNGGEVLIDKGARDVADTERIEVIK